MDAAPAHVILLNMRKLFLIALVLAAARAAAVMRENVDGIDLSVDPRTPAQLEGFYAARGLPPPAIAAMQQYCFITIALRNRRHDVVWLVPDRWEFTDDTGHTLQRVPRSVWDARWDALNVPSGARSAFNWTQLPDARDLQPDEPVGGNLALTPAHGAVNIVAIFPIGLRDSTRTVRVRFSDLHCGKDSE